MKSIIALALSASFAGALSFASPAAAQSTVSYVSGLTGDDARSFCSRAAPCATLNGALGKTAAGGEIIVVDPSNTPPMTITKAITIRAEHTGGRIEASGAPGIIVQVGPNDVVTLDGLEIIGLAGVNSFPPGLTGVQFVSGKALNIIKCRIDGFTGSPGYGVGVASTTPNARVVIRQSEITNNVAGIALPGSGVANIVYVDQSFIDSNSSYGVGVNGAANSVVVANSTIANSQIPVNLANGGTLASFGPSNVIGGAGPSLKVPFN